MKKPSVIVSLGLFVAAAWLVQRFPILGRII
jgi:hypothetical protein